MVDGRSNGGAGYTDDTPVEHPEGTQFNGAGGFGLFVVVAENQAPDFLLQTILRRGRIMFIRLIL